MTFDTLDLEPSDVFPMVDPYVATGRKRAVERVATSANARSGTGERNSCWFQFPPREFGFDLSPEEEREQKPVHYPGLDMAIETVLSRDNMHRRSPRLIVRFHGMTRRASCGTAGEVKRNAIRNNEQDPENRCDSLTCFRHELFLRHLRPDGYDNTRSSL